MIAGVSSISEKSNIFNICINIRGIISATAIKA